MIANFPAPLRLPTDAELLAALKAYSIDRPIHSAPWLPSDQFPCLDLDAAAQDVVEGRRRHRPRNVFAPNQYAMKMRRN